MAPRRVLETVVTLEVFEMARNVGKGLRKTRNVLLLLSISSDSYQYIMKTLFVAIVRLFELRTV